MKRKILVFPTWIIVLLCKPLLEKEHVLRKHVTLSDWEKGSTQLNDRISIYFWCLGLIYLAIFIIKMFYI